MTAIWTALAFAARCAAAESGAVATTDRERLFRLMTRTARDLFAAGNVLVGRAYLERLTSGDEQEARREMRRGRRCAA
jgi:hypothetical protein